MTTIIWLVFLVVAFFFGYVCGMIHTSRAYDALLKKATKEIERNSAANHALFSELKRKGVF